MATTRHLLLFLVSTAIYLFISTSIYGGAYDDHHLGAAKVLPDDDHVPEAEAQGEGNEDLHPQYDPNFTKALECFNDRYIYGSCDVEYRLTQNGELSVPHDYTDQYCGGPCLKETHLVLECIEEILGHFQFYNKATCKDVRETIKTGCGYGSRRGDFNVAEHVRVDEDIASKLSTSMVYATVLMITFMGWHLFF